MNINMTTSIKTKRIGNISSSFKNAIKQNEIVKNYRSFKSMIFIQERNNSVVDKWQKQEVYPFCD